MPINAVARPSCVTDKRIWRVETYYVFKVMGQVVLSRLCGIGLVETVTSRGHHDVTNFVNMDRESRLVIFATPGKGEERVRTFAANLKGCRGNFAHGTKVVCVMSTFLAAAKVTFSKAAVTAD
jgi:hypothetical protein